MPVIGPVGINLGVAPGVPMMMPQTGGTGIGQLLGSAVTGGSAAGSIIGTILDVGIGLLSPGRSNAPMTAAMSVVPAMAGTAGRALMTGMMGEVGGMLMRGIMGAGGMRVRAGTRRALRALTPVIGLQMAASSLGLDIGTAARVFASRGRRRGISSADVRRTYRTLNFVSNIQKRLSTSRICRKR